MDKTHNPVIAPTTVTLATANVLNLARPQRVFYANQDPYSEAEYQRKLDWLGGRIRALNADVLAVQEIWDETALRAAVSASGLHYTTVAAPWADREGLGAQGTPAVGLVTRLKVLEMHSLADFPKGLAIDIPGLGMKARFERPPLFAKVQTKQGQVLQVMSVHMKSKRPKYLEDEAGNLLEDRNDPKDTALATLRSLMIRAAEAVALRHFVVDALSHTSEPLILMGDFNDSTHSVTTQMVAATSEVVYNRAARDVALFDAYAIQGENALRKDVAYSHIFQGSPDVLDQILVSEEFVPGSKFAIGDVRRVDYFNDHLHEGRNRGLSDHGFVRAVLRLHGSS